MSADTWINAEAMGAKVGFPNDNQPMCGLGDPLVKTSGDIDRIKSPDLERGRWPSMLEALEQLRRRLGEEAFIVSCFDQYPFSLACAAMGVDQLMLKLLDDRPFVEALLDKCSTFTTTYAQALGAAGADMLSGGDSPAGLLGPSLYREVALPYEMRVIEEIKSNYTGPVSLHICGNATPVLVDMSRSGADVLELDHQVDLATACRAIGPDVAIWGNLDPVSLLARGTPEDVQRAAGDALRVTRANNHRRFLLSSGCTLAMETPAENLHALFQAARRIG
jgi:uroporphyrinogen decarboxylase